MTEIKRTHFDSKTTLSKKHDKNSKLPEKRKKRTIISILKPASSMLTKIQLIIPEKTLTQISPGNRSLLFNDARPKFRRSEIIILPL